MYNNFKTYMYGLLDRYNNSVVKFVEDYTDKLFISMRNGGKGTYQITPKQLTLNRFYLIQYNYNGNKCWCPLYAMEYRVVKNKHILYALQLEFLPPKYKMDIFPLIFDNPGVKKIISENDDINSTKEERGLPLQAEAFYNILKNNGKMNYALSAYDLNKIEKVFMVSTKMLPEILMTDCKRYNSFDMKNLLENSRNSSTEKTLEIIIEEYEKLINDYEHDSVEYHKRVSAFEKHFKLFKD